VFAGNRLLTVLYLVSVSLSGYRPASPRVFRFPRFLILFVDFGRPLELRSVSREVFLPTHDITNTEKTKNIRPLCGIRSHGPIICVLKGSKLLVRRRDKRYCHVNSTFVRVNNKIKLLRLFKAFQSLRTN